MQTGALPALILVTAALAACNTTSPLQDDVTASVEAPVTTFSIPTLPQSTGSDLFSDELIEFAESSTTLPTPTTPAGQMVRADGFESITDPLVQSLATITNMSLSAPQDIADAHGHPGDVGFVAPENAELISMAVNGSGPNDDGYLISINYVYAVQLVPNTDIAALLSDLAASTPPPVHTDGERNQRIFGGEQDFYRFRWLVNESVDPDAEMINGNVAIPEWSLYLSQSTVYPALGILSVRFDGRIDDTLEAPLLAQPAIELVDLTGLGYTTTSFTANRLTSQLTVNAALNGGDIRVSDYGTDFGDIRVDVDASFHETVTAFTAALPDWYSEQGDSPDDLLGDGNVSLEPASHLFIDPTGKTEIRIRRSRDDGEATSVQVAATDLTAFNQFAT